MSNPQGDYVDFCDANNDPDRPRFEAATGGGSTDGILRRYNVTELGFAERLVDAHADELRFCSTIGWLCWSGTYWARDERDRPAELVKQTIREAMAELAGIPDPKKQDALRREMLKYEANFRVRGILELAKSDEKIRVVAADLDAEPWTLNLINGALDLRTQCLRPHAPGDLITKLAGAAYDKNATCPRFERFLNEIFADDPEIVAFVRRAVGYSLTGDVREQVLFVLFGTGSNGKSVFLQILQALLGTYATQAASDTFMAKRTEGVRNDIARLVGARMVATIETNEGARLDEALVKTTTGGDTVTARYLFREYFEFKPAFKLYLAANHKPTIRGQDFAIWRRVLLWPFGVAFTGAAADKTLPVKLLAELSGILNWALAGLKDWQRDGLRPPAAVLAATASYKTDMDVLGEWLEARCVLSPAHEIESPRLYRDYCDWTADSGEKPLSKRAFTLRLSERGIEARRTGRARYCVGIDLAFAGRFGLSDTCDTSALLSDTSLTRARVGEVPQKGAHVSHVSPSEFETDDDLTCFDR